MISNLLIYNLSSRELETLQEYLDTAQDKSWIRPCKSHVRAPILFVLKSNGTMQLCVNYWELNKVTVKNHYPILLVSELLDRLSEAAIFSKLDLHNAYHRLRIREENEWKAAFKTRYSHLMFTTTSVNAPLVSSTRFDATKHGDTWYCCQLRR
jgi:hypothetical protein